MHSFISSAASSSSGRAERPAAAAASSSPSSAEQPATPSHLKIISIRDVQRWVAEGPIASCSSADAQRIREAVAVLSHPKPGQEDVQPLLSKWQVAQKKVRRNARRPLGEMLKEFRGKVIKIVQKLQQQLSDSAIKPVDGSSTVNIAQHASPNNFDLEGCRVASTLQLMIAVLHGLLHNLMALQCRAVCKNAATG